MTFENPPANEPPPPSREVQVEAMKRNFRLIVAQIEPSSEVMQISYELDRQHILADSIQSD